MRAAVTNAAVGEEVGLTHAQISRIRAGHRLPSIETMSRIQIAYGWTLDAQIAARLNGGYGPEFERRLADRYGEAEAVDA